MTTTEQPNPDVARPATESEQVGAPSRGKRGAGESARRAYDRRRRRLRQADPRLVGAGLPIRSALARVPAVVVSILLLGAGIAGVLAINTRTDEMGLQVNRVLSENADLELQLEALEQQVAEGDSTPRIAREARRLGMVPAADPAIITIDKTGGYTIIGTPTAQPGAATAAPGSATPSPAAGAPAAPATTPAAPATTPAAAPTTPAAATTPAGR